MTINSAQIGGYAAIDPAHAQKWFGRVPGPDHYGDGVEYTNDALERTNALAWALKHPEPESPYAVIARAEVYLRYLAQGVTASSEDQ